MNQPPSDNSAPRAQDDSSDAPLPIPEPNPKAINKPHFLITFLIVLLLLLPVFLPVFTMLMPGPLTKDETVIIPRGSSVQEIASTLEDHGVLHNKFIFRIAARIIASDNLQAGEYNFPAGQNIADIVLTLRDGHSVVRKFTVAEGLTSLEITNLLKANPSLSGEILSTPPEGSLLPETYHYSYGETRANIIERMQKSQREIMKDLWEKRAQELPLKTPEDAIIMASIIEKETGKKVEERARVAGVFYNRLRQGMRLQSDPTVIYAVTNGLCPLDRNLTHKDLEIISPYNTYVNAGLPPKPICNPGRASIEAALHPETNDYLYFVADGTGGHAFAKDLPQHNRNVARWLSLSKP